jgi:hypothetical protein
MRAIHGGWGKEKVWGAGENQIETMRVGEGVRQVLALVAI